MQFKGVLFYESFLCRRKLLGERKEIRETASLSPLAINCLSLLSICTKIANSSKMQIAF
jgi:hypothetical protein